METKVSPTSFIPDHEGRAAVHKCLKALDDAQEVLCNYIDPENDKADRHETACNALLGILDTGDLVRAQVLLKGGDPEKAETIGYKTPVTQSVEITAEAIANLEAWGWRFYQFAPNEYQWMKFGDSDVVAQQGDPTWAKDLSAALDPK